MRIASALLIALIARASHADDARTARSVLAAQVAAETETLDRTLATVDDKLTAAETQRVRRVRAAYRLLRAPLAVDASADDRMAAARRRAADRQLLDHERALLSSEAAQLRTARTQRTAEAARIAGITLPTELARPVAGPIIRHAGVYAHETSRATLSRRGIDFEVSDRAAVVAPEAGVVRYAGPIRGLDAGVILDHGDYLTVIAKLRDLAIPVGTRVARGDRIGIAARARVYFEVRVEVGPGGLPIDPESLLH